MNAERKHRPSSHPVLVRWARREPGTPLPPGPSELAEMTDRLDFLALVVAALPDHALTPVQAERVRIIARELLRRA